CAYCGLSRVRKYTSHQSFIRVEWPTYSLDEIITAITQRQHRVKRICVSMITHPHSPVDLRIILQRLREKLSTAISLLIVPTLLTKNDLMDFKRLGADRLGIAIDTATPELFCKHRGSEIGGPHSWEKYWQTFKEGIEIFGRNRVGAHFIVGLGETEQQMCSAIQQARDAGGSTHLFSFYPEAGSPLEQLQPPPVGSYRRIQLFRYLCDNDISSFNNLEFNSAGQIVSFGIDLKTLEEIINSGKPFQTSGCPDNATGEVACTRPFGNSPPGDNVRNFPFELNAEDIARIKCELALF
ncbi:MAG: radical SAM protein, partial [Candidatus Sumerlaeia bacterium]|nr:radical SAM protein [Candidatus Sumerlaeia bacterium]